MASLDVKAKEIEVINIYNFYYFYKIIVYTNL